MAIARWQRILQASKEEAIQAVKVFNDPTGVRRLEGFVVHMHLAWLYLLQAKFTKEKREYRIPDPSHKGRYVRVDGEHKTRELAWFAKESWDDSSAVRKNLEFFILVRNKVEHRHTGKDEALGTVIGGECHSLLLNYEAELTQFAGVDHSLATVLNFPVFIGGFTDEGKASLVKMTKSLPAELRTFLAEYRSSLDETIAKDPKYALKLTVVLEKTNRNGDLALNFYDPSQLNDEQRKAFDELAEKGVVITNRKNIPVSNLGNYKAEEARLKVQAEIPYKFNSNHFTQAWKIGKFRPDTNAKNKENTRADFVVYDKTFEAYSYTPFYVKYLIKNCSIPDGFKKITGREPELKEATAA